MQIQSPLTGSHNVIKESEIKTDFLIKNYREMLGVDVSKYFKNIKAVEIYECLDSGYRFYWPFNITGDGKFYEELQKHPWYYMNEKWEYGKALDVIGDAKTLLEVGCSQGEFLEKARAKGIACIGLELNAHAAEKAREKGLNALEEMAQVHVQKNKEKYDVVCSFQVMEHIAPIGEFIQASVDALKPGGKLIISVPNNDSIVFTTTDNIVLNMPPHHMGLWNTNSLLALQHFFPLRMEEVHLEPLQSYHVHFAKMVAKRSFSEKLVQKHLSWIPFIKIIGDKFINMNVRAVAPHIVGHSIMVVYTKK